MAYTIEKKDVWFGFIADEAGALAARLEQLATTPIDLDFLFARPLETGCGLFFVAPITGTAQVQVARKAGLRKSSQFVNLNIYGPDKRGLSLKICRAIADAGISFAGLSGMAAGKMCRYYISIPKADAAKAQRALKKALA